MKKGTGIVVLIVIAAIVIGVAVFEFMGRRRGVSPVSDALQALVNSAPAPAPVEKATDTTKEESASAGPTAKANGTAKPPARGRGPTSKPGPAAASSGKDAPAPARGDVPAGTKPAPAPPRRPLPASVTMADEPRIDTFVAANQQGWMSYDIAVKAPLLLRAGGVVRDGDIVSGPSGLPPAPGSAERQVIPDAPRLALIGRVCSDESCSPPFIVGGRTLLCPSTLGVSGELQLWINNYVQVDGYQTVSSYARMAGGYRFQAEPAAASACAASNAAATPTGAAKPPADGDVLRSRTYVISSRQNAWKPFFLPLDRPITIRATGEMQPHERTRGTGPNGITVPDVPRWIYPGTKNVIVDTDNSLMEKSLPYQALIGRLCSDTSCGTAFFVGAERTICPDPARNDRLELWINHIVPKTDGLTVPFADLTFQGRRGEYRFEVTVGGVCK